MSGFRYEKDSEKIVTISLEAPTAPVGEDTVFEGLREVVERLEKDDVAGVILASVQETLSSAPQVQEKMTSPNQTRKAVYERLTSFKNRLRRIESLKKPVVAAIDHTALGAELEIFLAAHNRIALDDPELRIGFPEVPSGLLPGFGGLVRLVHLLGLEKALPLLQNGTVLSPEGGLEVGLINELANDREDLILKAKDWIRANPEATQPWDRKGYQLPGGAPAHPRVAQTIFAAPAILRKKFPERNPIQETILSSVVECAQVNFDSALRIESRYLVERLFAQQ